MLWLNLSIVLFVLVLASLYFLPYRQLKDKVFNHLILKVEEIERIEYTFGRNKIILQRKDGLNDWSILEPVLWDADHSAMFNIVTKLKELVIEDGITNLEGDISEYGIGKNGALTLHYKGKSNPVVLQFGNRASSYRSYDDEVYIYITKDKAKGVFIVNENIVNAFPNDISRLQNMIIFRGYYPQVTVVEVTSAEHNYILTRTNNGWLLHRKSLFDDQVQPIITELLEIESVGFLGKHVQLPPKPAVCIRMCINKATTTRYFFDNEDDNTLYSMPLAGKIMLVSKALIDDVVEFG